MSYVFGSVRALQGMDKVGSHQCVALVSHFTNAGSTVNWSEGASVVGNQRIVLGTAIATFVNKRYANRPHGNHAALFVGFEGKQIRIMDQWTDAKKTTISSRLIRSLGKNKDGTFKDPSNNADAFSVIEP